MNATKILIALGIAAVLALALVSGGWFVNSAYAQGPTQNPQFGYGACHNNQAVLDLLKISASDLQAQRQAGTSLLDIAKAQGVSEKDLVDALIQPIAAMHGWLAQNYPLASRHAPLSAADTSSVERDDLRQSNADQMTQFMRDWITQDIRETKYGTMTDLRLLGGHGGMMGNWNGANGSGGMMGGWNSGNGFGGMMGNWNGANGFGGMMGNWQR